MQFLNLRMEQDKFSSMNQSSSNANMPRDTVETLKQIQKQGLSVSIVTSGGGSSSATADNRSKANILPVEKTAKITPVTPSRSQTTAENKAQIMPARMPSITDNTRLLPPRATSQPGFLDNKGTTNQTRSNQPSVSESKGFTPAWSTANSSVDKTQGTVNRSVVTTPVSKMQTSQVRVTPVSRSNQTMHSEGKIQARVPTAQRIPQSQQLIEGKLQNNQERVNPTTSSDVKSFSNQARMGQQFAISQDKSIPVPKGAPQKAADAKTTSQLNTNKPVDVKAQGNRMTPNIKVMSDVNQNKIRSNYAAKSEAKTNISGMSPMIVENKMVNSVRLVNVVEGNSTRTTQCKSSSTQMRIHPNVSGVETSAVQTKMICTSVHTKMMVFQSIGQPGDKIILQGAKADPDMIQKFDMSAEATHGNAMSRVSTTKRSATVVSSPVKKKCVKRPSPSSEMSNKNVDGNNVNSPDDGNEKAEAHFLNNINTRTDLTITPVRPPIVSTPSSSASSVGMVRMHGELLETMKHQNLGNAWEKSAALVKSPRGKARSRGRRKLEPVCLTLSSDEEEEHMHASFNAFEEALGHQMFHHESEGSKSGQSSPVYQDEDNPESDDPHFPGVTDINPKPPDEDPYEDEEEEDEEKDMDEMDMEMEEESMGEDEEEEMDESEIDEEEVPPEEEEPSHINRPIDDTTVGVPLLCRSVRIGSYKIHPFNNNKTLNVYLDSEGISFNSPLVSDASKIVKVTVKPSDITHMLVHFGKCLPILFIYTTPSSAEGIRKLLTMFNNDQGFYDPNSSDEKQKKLTFLIDSVTEDQRHFFRHCFINEQKLQEIDQKTANEILVKSTPSNTGSSQLVRCEIITLQPQPQPPPPPPPPPVQVSQENVVTVTAIQTPMVKVINTKPATRLFTYPPPPQTGGIPITTEDVACLNEGEFLNDAIIDFYLKYVFYEKLSDYNRDKTHIFSSYFYHRLTHKPERARPGDDVQKNIQMRRHSQVKTWTRHVDIFSKDFIIIPVNQNVHWFLAIICYPGLVPDAPDSPIKCDLKTNKSIDNVTSTDDQDENKTSKEPNSTIDDENSTSSNSMFENEEPDTEEPEPEAPDSSTHPDKNRRKKEVPCICIFDSLNGPNRSRIATMLREYLEVEWKLKKGTRKVFDKSTMHGYIMQCPQQTNYSDCGIYVLQYVESFFENPILYFDTPIPNLSNWFPKEKVAKKREELKELIFNLQKKYTASAASRIKNTAENVPSSQSQLPQNDNR